MALWYEEKFDDKARYSLRVERTVFDECSEFQHIQIVDTAAYGRALVIDDIFMTSDRDEFFYHEMLVHPALVTAPSVERVLIIGGGDGGTAREVLRHSEVKEVIMVEIDGTVVDACKKHMPGLGAWTDPRLQVRIDDGISFVKNAEVAPFDVVFLDGTDPVGPGKGLFNSDFYRGVKRVLKPAGLFALQSESPFYMGDVFLDIQRRLGEIFSAVTPYFGPVPIYASGSWSWTCAGDAIDLAAMDAVRLEVVERDCKYYNRDIHRAALALPNYLRQVLGRR
ncbi:MAG: polyamine aminopropyltransferase [Proteobacteria bacterium]|nr:polyamine aminopropyltransferase [Pseudomonadota bacterium]